jgi:hypothetical protein
MQFGRLINKLHNNALANYQTENFEKLLNSKNMQAIWNANQPGANFFPDDYAISYTALTPEFDAHGRMIIANDTVIAKFDRTELTDLLLPNEVQALLQRALNSYQLVNRIATYQGKNGVELKNPLSPVNL